MRCIARLKVVALFAVAHPWQGIAKTLLEAFMEAGIFSGENARIAEDVTKSINDCVPARFRIPPEFIRDVGSMNSSKAADMLSFIAFFSEHVFVACLRPKASQPGPLRAQQLRLWRHFAALCRVLSATEVTDDDLDSADYHCREFVRLLPVVFPKHAPWPINLHLTMHMTDVIRRFGPTYTTWW
jgi:hypothetical protein